MEAKFYIIFGTFFLLSVLLMIHVNSRLMRHADKRLESVHKMVDRMAGSADKLAESICRMKDIISEMKEEDNSRIKQLTKNHDDFREAYNKLLQTYKVERTKREELYNSYITALKDLASRPTINNTHSTTEIV